MDLDYSFTTLRLFLLVRQSLTRGWRQKKCCYLNQLIFRVLYIWTCSLIGIFDSGFSRLETIFEVPLNRRNGSESWFGQRRIKRFLEFLDAGEARKPKKPLVGVGKSGSSSSRTRRGAFPKDEPSLIAQDVDSLLCDKLEQLNLWLIHDQKDSWQMPP